MAKLLPFFGSCTQGHNYTVQSKLGILPSTNVGTCTLTASTSGFMVTCKATVNNYLTFSGTFTIVLWVSDQDENAQSGPLTLTVNGRNDPEASYAVDGNAIVIKSSPSVLDGTFVISPDGQNTKIKTPGVYPSLILRY
jgi:hypothetical protein